MAAVSGTAVSLSVGRTLSVTVRAPGGYHFANGAPAQWSVSPSGDSSEGTIILEGDDRDSFDVVCQVTAAMAASAQVKLTVQAYLCAGDLCTSSDTVFTFPVTAATDADASTSVTLALST